jgi:hypothetical protein
MQKLIVLGTYHNVQGLKNFGRSLTDPDYKPILEYLKQKHDVDFIFEEATGHGPSIASDMAAGGYLDIDSETTDEALSHFPEDSHTLVLEILHKFRVQEIPTKLGLTVQEWRESTWVTKIKAQQFKTGLVICGVVHTLSIAFRLKAEGFGVEAYCYQPIKIWANKNGP